MDGILVNSRLTITFEAGIDDDGKPIYKNKNFNNVKIGATHQQLSATAQALAPLQKHTLINVERFNTYVL